MYDPTYRPGDNLYTNSVISYNPDTGKMNWYFQFTPGDMWDYDEVGTHILIDGQVAGQHAQADHPFRPQRLPLHHGAGQRRHGARQAVHGQRQLDQGHRPEDRQAGRLRTRTSTSRSIRRWPIRPPATAKKVCPGHAGGNNYCPSAYSQKTKLLYIPALSTCEEITHRHQQAQPRRPASTAATSRPANATKAT